MSDIYLQITETPTVVTLSAPVVSGALASTVTVANTVTVALDSNSLSALENVTVTVGAAITGTVTVSNFPATQPVSIASVTIGNTVTIAGTVTANLGNAFINTSGGYQPVQFSTGLPVANERDGITFDAIPFLVAGSVTIGSALPAGTNRIGVVTIGNIQRAGDAVQSSLLTEVGSGYLLNRSFLGAGTAQIGSVTASISNSVTIGSLPLIAGTVTVSNAVELAQALLDQSASYGSLDVNIGGVGSVTLPISGTVTVGNTVTIAGTVTANPTGTQTIAGTVTATIRNGEDAILNDAPSGYTVIRALSHWFDDVDNEIKNTSQTNPLPISGTVTVGNSVTIASFATSVTARLINPAGTAVTYAEVGTAGSPSIDVLSVQGVTSGTAIPISISSVTIGSLPAISGTVTANTFALQGTAVTTSNFTSTTASTVLANYNATREVLTIFNEGAGNLHICAGATCTTIAYQVRLSAGDYYEVPNHQTTITHSAVFATAGTARVTQLS